MNGRQAEALRAVLRGPHDPTHVPSQIASPDLVASGLRIVKDELSHASLGHKTFLRSSTLQVPGYRTERLIEIVKAVGCRHYISGPSAEAYLDEELLKRAGITLEYMRYDYPEYPQLYPPFDPNVSILDLLFMTGKDASKSIWEA